VTQNLLAATQLLVYSVRLTTLSLKWASHIQCSDFSIADASTVTHYSYRVLQQLLISI